MKRRCVRRLAILTVALCGPVSASAGAAPCMMATPTFERMEEATATVDAIGRAGIELRMKVADEISELAASFQHMCRQRCSVTNPLWSNRTMRFATLMRIAALVAAPAGLVLADDA